MVLEARENAEKIGYPVVGETEKEASNVIDYDIHDEITVDSSSVLNANNNTTTGMATIIPGVNAPKLIESTSIYSDVVNKTATATTYGNVSIVIDQGETKTALLRPLTIQSQSGAYTFTVGDYFNGYTTASNASIIIPASGIYLLEFTYYSTVNVFYRSYDVYVNLNKITTLKNDTYYSQTGSAYPTASMYVNMNKNDQLAIYYIAQCTGGGTGNVMQCNVTTKITKL